MQIFKSGTKILEASKYLGNFLFKGKKASWGEVQLRGHWVEKNSFLAFQGK